MLHAALRLWAFVLNGLLLCTPWMSDAQEVQSRTQPSRRANSRPRRVFDASGVSPVSTPATPPTSTGPEPGVSVSSRAPLPASNTAPLASGTNTAQVADPSDLNATFGGAPPPPPAEATVPPPPASTTSVPTPPRNQRPPAAPTPPSAIAPPAPPHDGDLRLIDRMDTNGFVSGALQVYKDGAFGAICPKNFQAVDADVACKQLGYIGGFALPLAIDRRRAIEALPDGVEVPIVLENIGCSGNETRLVECPVEERIVPTQFYSIDYDFDYYTRQAAYCDLDYTPAPYAYVACGTITGQETGDMRLRDAVTSDDGNAQYGRLQVFGRGGWGTVCDPRPTDITRSDVAAKEIDEATIQIACGELGFSSGVKTRLAMNTLSREERRNPILLGGLSCEGDESNLLECPGAVIGEGPKSRNCGVAETLSVICFNKLDTSRDGNLRLVNGEKTIYFEFGRLEVFLNGFWGNVCDKESFTPDSALVACRILGYDGGTSIFYYRDANGEHLHAIEQVSANVPVALANVDCDGNETSILQCSSSPPDIRRCFIDGTEFTDGTILACSNSDAGCPPVPPRPESLRLSGGFGTLCDPIYTGFVEIFHAGVWGAICRGKSQSDHRNTAPVVCRQLGFPHGSMVDPSVNPAEADRDILVAEAFEANFALNSADEAEEPIHQYWLAQTRCNGTEQQLVDCDLLGGFIATDDQDERCFISAGLLSRFTVECRMFPLPGTEEEAKADV